MITVPICLMADEKYIVPTTVMLSSLFENKNEDTKYSIYILADNMDENTISFFENQTKLNFEIKVVPIDNPYKNYKNSNPNMSCTTFLKFKIPFIFKQYEKILYLDVDTIILKDLSQLYNIDINSYYVAMVEDFHLVKYNEHKRLLLDNYYNAGVMLFNSEQIRQDFNIDIFGETYINNSDIFLHHDQDVFNVLFKNNIKTLPATYNWMVSNSYFWKRDVLNFYKLSNNKIKLNNISILHYTTGLKPWKYKFAPYNHIWQKQYIKDKNNLPTLDFKSDIIAIIYLYLRDHFNLKKIDPFIKKIRSLF